MRERERERVCVREREEEYGELKLNRRIDEPEMVVGLKAIVMVGWKAVVSGDIKVVDWAETEAVATVDKMAEEIKKVQEN